MHNHKLYLTPKVNHVIFTNNEKPIKFIDIEDFRAYVDDNNLLKWDEEVNEFHKELIKDGTLKDSLRRVAVYNYGISGDRSDFEIVYTTRNADLLLKFDYLDDIILSIIKALYHLYPDMVFIDPDVTNESNKETYDVCGLDEFINTKSKLSKYLRKRKKEVKLVPKKKSFWTKIFGK